MLKPSPRRGGGLSKICALRAPGRLRPDAELDAYARDNVDTIDHPVGTVPMGAGDAGALYSDLRVKGTVGLRVVDASAFVSI